MSSEIKHLLHVDDDPDLTSYVNVILADVIDVTTVRTLDEARTLLSANQYNVILLDLTLPDGSGLELVEELNTQQPAIPIVIFSSHDITNPGANVAKVFEKGHFSENNLINAVRTLAA